jgi:hypothetical protein
LVALRTQRIDGGPGETEFGGVVNTTASVVIASRTDQPLQQATKLAVVPFSEGRLTLRRESHGRESAEVAEHYFGGRSKASQIEVRDGAIEIRIREAEDDGSPIERIEIEIGQV